MKRRMRQMLAAFAAVCMLVLLVPGAPVQAANKLVQMPGYTVEQFDAPLAFQAVKDVDAYKLADKNSGRIASIKKNQVVNCWGQTDNGYFFVECGGTLGYVWFDSMKVAAAPAAPAPAAATAPAAPAPQIQVAPPAAAAGVIFIGDSRMVTIRDSVIGAFGSCPVTVVAQGGARYDWLKEKGIPQADPIIGKGSKVLINMGVNDRGSGRDYAQLINAYAANWVARGARVYYASVNPVYPNMWGITDESVMNFNNYLRSNLAPYITWIDSHSYLQSVGVHAVDGLHYKDDTNLVLYNFYLASMR